MNRIESVGIYGIGLHLPEQIRRNDWWPEAIVQRWREQREAHVASPHGVKEADLTPGIREILRGMAEYQDDPFGGARERRVAPAELPTSEMEIAAAREALSRAGVKPEEIGMLLISSQVPDFLCVPNGPRVHHQLGLPQRCMTFSVDTACNSFLAQLTLAEQMIKGGQVRYALLVQSARFPALMRQDDQTSPWFGEGASAVVVGPVAAGRGVLGHSHFTDGSLYKALVVGVPGKNWFQGGELTAHCRDPIASRQMLLRLADMGKQAVDAALEAAGVRHADVSFYASHQATAWFRKATQAYIGLSNARWVDIFPWTGSLANCNIPFVLGMGEREGLLRPGDLVASYTGGSGVTWTSLVLRWGR